MAIYSFVTTLVTPVSDEFDCMDFNPGSISQILLFSEAEISRGTPWITIDSGELAILSDDGIASIFRYELPIGQQFTFEFQFRPVALPTNLDALDKSRFFVAAFDNQDNAGGLLISQSGLAIVSQFGNAVMPIAGSQHIIEEGTSPYTVRMVVDGVTNIMDLYITKTSELTTLGHQLRYTSAAPVSPSSVISSVRIEIVGQGAHPVHGHFRSLRCACNALRIPNRRPIADTGRDQTAVMGSVIRLDGTESYDPEGSQLTYKWSLIGTPDQSDYVQRDSGGFTTDDGDTDGFTDVFQQAGDPWSAANSPSLQPGDVLIVDDTQYVVSSYGWAYNTSTSKWDRSVGFDPSRLVVTTETIPDDLVAVSWSLFFQSTFFDNRTLPQPAFVPDVHGLYTLQLVVNDGSLDSLPAEGLVNITDSNVPFGVVPDVNFIWDYLSDAWNLYDDRDPVTVMWSGFAQAAANLLLTAWQHDYGKSLVDVQRTFQRRWLNYSFLLDEPPTERADVKLHILRGVISSKVEDSITFTSPVYLKISRNGGDLVRVDLTGTMTKEEIVDAINVAFGDQAVENPIASLAHNVDGILYGGPYGAQYGILSYIDSWWLVLGNSELIVVSKDGTANSYFGWGSTYDTQNELTGPSCTTAPPRGFSVPGTPVLSFMDEGVLHGDLLVLGEVGEKGTGYQVSKAVRHQALTTISDIKNWTGNWWVPSTVTSTYTDFTRQLVETGDIARFDVRVPGAPDSVEILCEVRGVDGKVLGFDARPLLEATAGNVEDYEITFMGVRRVSNIPVDALVVRIPRLQEIILDPTVWWDQNSDYVLEVDANGVNGIRFKDVFSFSSPPPDTVWAEVTFLDNRPTIENNFGKAVNFKVEDLTTRTDDLDYLSAVRGLWYAYFNGPSLWNVRIGVQILLGLPFAEVDGIITDINHTFNAAQARMVVQDKADPAVYRTYFIPRDVVWEGDGETMIGTNPDTGEDYKVGDTVLQFNPLSKGVEIHDWIKTPEWWKGYCGQGEFLEVRKFFTFLMIADIDVFNIANLVFAMDLVKTLKPHYTFPMFVVLKRLPPDYIEVTDDIAFRGILHLFDDPASQGARGTGGSFRHDDTDESGNHNWAYDGGAVGVSKPAYLYDVRRLFPEMYKIGIMRTLFAGGYLPFDWIWAYDDGGGADPIPLSGPDSSPPPPYGPAVGVIQWDSTYPAGKYTRAKVL
jgi:hypothetical protein